MRLALAFPLGFVALGLALAIALVGGAAPVWADASEPGLVAAYSFDEGSGGVVHDASGNGHTGAIVGATWTAGRDAGALSFDGTSAYVNLGGLGTFYQGGFTLESWVKKQSADQKDVAVLGSWVGGDGGGPMIWVDHVAARYQLTLNVGLSNYLDSVHNPIAGQWQHLAATYDGTTARFYIDGVEVATRSVSGSVGNSNVWRIGAFGSSPVGFFDGLIDNVRIYDRALTASQIQTDMNRPVINDVTPPSVPGALSVSGGVGVASLSWGAASDEVGVVGYEVYRSGSSGFVPGFANRVGQAAGTGYLDSGLAEGVYYYRVAAVDGAGNLGPVSNEASATVTGDTAAPTVALTAPLGGTVAGPVVVSADASDDQAVVGVQFRLDGQDLGVEDTSAPYSVVWDTRGELNGSHTLTAVARDGAGHVVTSAAVSVTVSNSGVSSAGLLAAYGFDEGAGAVAVDSSGNNRTASLVGAGWAGGRFGGAVSLSGSGSEVDPPALGTFYKTGFSYEAWVFKQSSKRDVAVVGSWDGGQGGGAMIWVDHISGHYRLTLGGVFGNYLDSGQAPAVGRWQHVAATYDGVTARFYIDGVETASTSFSGNVGDSNVWRIGAFGSSPVGFFDGLIDNVRIYDRALTASEVGVDMASRIQTDVTPPSVPGALSVSGGVGVASLSWGAASDEVGVVGYEVYRSGSSGFVPGFANRVGQAAGTGYLDSGLAEGVYYYRVAAVDGAGNLGPVSNEASATVTGDTAAPTVALTAPLGGTVAGPVVVSADASDDQAVVGVQFRLDGQDLGVEDTSAPYSVVWDTRGELNGSHTLTAVARDGAGHVVTSAAVSVTVSNSGVSSAGLLAAYGFDEGAGAVAVDSSGNNRTASLVGAGWAGGGRFGGAVSLSGSGSEVDPPALGTFYKTGFSYEAWVFKQSSKRDVAVVGSWDGGQGGGAMIWVDHISGHYRLTLGGVFGNYLDSGQAPAVGRWQHVAATYDGVTARFYIDGVETASSSFSGNVGDSNAWRIGAFGSSPVGFFDGLIDNVRIYDRALTASEVGVDMASRIQTDVTPPSVPGALSASGGWGVATLAWGRRATRWVWWGMRSIARLAVVLFPVLRIGSRNRRGRVISIAVLLRACITTGSLPWMGPGISGRSRTRRARRSGLTRRRRRR